MIEKGLTAYHLAKETGISQATLSRILNKESKPNTNTLKTLSKYFGENEEWLLTGRGGSSGINNVRIKGSNNGVVGVNNGNVDSCGAGVSYGGSDVSALVEEKKELLERLAASQRQIDKLLEIISNKLT